MLRPDIMLTASEDGWVVAEYPALPACVDQGRTRAKAMANIEEAIAAWCWAEAQKLKNLGNS